ncbi:MAG: hypothetical protein H7829_05770 [Magnetococcus sp. THC-1_WYH]
MIYLLPSADYEVYLGANHDREEAVLIEPTNRLLEMYESLGLRTTLFCDVACIWRYREWGREETASRMERQMIDAIVRGHDVQAHLHPHWLKTDWIEGRYLFSPEDYLLGTLDADETRCQIMVEQLLQRVVTYLHGLLQPVDPEYRCIAFRAGGYGLQPRENMVLAALIKAGFVIDSSIIPGFIYHSGTHRVDFSATPDRANYWLDAKHGLSQPAPDGQGLFEIPIPAIGLTPLQALRINLPEALRQTVTILTGQDHNHPPRGIPCGETPPQPASRWHRAYWRGRALLQTRFHRLEAGLSLPLLQTTWKRYLQRFPQDQDLYLAINCHPKGMQQRHFHVLKRFHQKTAHHSPRPLRCLTFRDAWHQLRTVLFTKS